MLQNVEIAVEGSGQRNLLVGSTGFGGIQAALDAAVAGDAVRLAAGVYTGTWNYSDAGLTVLAQPDARINGSFLTAGTDGITVVGANLADNITTGRGQRRDQRRRRRRHDGRRRRRRPLSSSTMPATW